jgi:hypothetical protein
MTNNQEEVKGMEDDFNQQRDIMFSEEKRLQEELTLANQENAKMKLRNDELEHKLTHT